VGNNAEQQTPFCWCHGYSFLLMMINISRARSTGRRVVGEMKEDLATIKSQIVDMRREIQQINKHQN
jgi:hypothetical protein